MFARFELIIRAGRLALSEINAKLLQLLYLEN